MVKGSIDWQGWNFVDPYEHFKNGKETTEWVLDELLSVTLSVIVDTETTGLKWYNKHRILGLNLGNPNTKQATFIPNERFPNAPEIWFTAEQLTELHNLSTKNKIIVGQNFSFDYLMSKKDNLELYDRRFLDTMILSYALDENQNSFKLENMCSDTFGYDAEEIERMLLTVIESKEYMIKSPWKAIWAYSCGDIANTGNYFNWVIDRLQNAGLLNYATQLSRYAIDLAEIAYPGIKIDIKQLTKLQIEFTAILDKIYKEDENGIPLPGREFDWNIGSWQQVKEHFPFLPKTNKETLENYKNNEFIEKEFPGSTEKLKLITRYREINTLKSTFIDQIERFLDEDNCIHPQFSIVKVRTPRISCFEPNLMNIPKREDEYSIKNLFIAKDGKILVSIDYSQIELRLIAHFSKEPLLLEAYQQGRNLHQETADAMGLSYAIAKNVNFSLPFGVSSDTFAYKYMKGDKVRSKEIHRTYSQTFKKVKKLYYDYQELARQKGRFRYTTGGYRNFIGIEHSVHKAMPNKIQGEAGEIYRISIGRIQKVIMTILDELPGVNMLLQVHDEILFEMDEDNWIEPTKKIVIMMEDFKFDVPIKVEVKVGKVWGQCKKVKDLGVEV